MLRCIIVTISKILQTKWFVSDEKTNYNKKYKKQIMLTIVASLCIQEISNYDCGKLIINSNSSSTDTTDEDISDILNKKGITRICCRSTMIISPVLRLMSVPDQFNIYNDNNTVIKKRIERLVIGNPEPKLK